MHNIVIRPRAKEDIKKIWRYTYENWGDEQANIYTIGLGQAIESLLVNPKIGISIKHVKEGFRLLKFKHHFVIYQLISGKIDVTRVLGENMYLQSHM